MADSCVLARRHMGRGLQPALDQQVKAEQQGTAQTTVYGLDGRP